jgi:hypothetical protein
MHATMPHINETYDIELDVTEVLICGKTLNQIKARDFYTGMRGPFVVFHGRLEMVEERNVITVRIGDALLLLEADGILPPLGSWVELLTSRPGVYDTNT